MPSRSCRQCIGLGILVSALAHGLGLFLLLDRQPPLPAGGQEAGLELDLALFAPVSGGETPVARLPDSTLATRESAAVARGLPEPVPEPVPTAMPVLEAETDILPEPEPEPETELKPEPVRETEPVSKPEPEPEPRIVTKAESASETDFESQPEPADVPKAEPASEPSRVVPAGAVAPSPLKPPPRVARPDAKTKPPPKPREVKRAEAGKRVQAKKAQAAGDKSPSLPASTLSPPPGTPSAPVTALPAEPSSAQGGHAGPLGAATTGDEADSAAARARAEEGYLSELQRAIKRHQRYPDQARSEGREGSTTLTFVLLADGGFDEVKVARTSGDRELDRAAIEALKRLNQFRPIPLEFGRRRWPLSVSIRFDLR